MQTNGNECSLGDGDGGSDGDGGDGGDGGTGGNNGGDTGAPYYYPFKNQISPIGVGGQYQEATTSALKQIDEDIRWSAIKLYEQGDASLATFKGFSRDLTKVTDALTVQMSMGQSATQIYRDTFNTLNRMESSLLHMSNCLINPKNNDCNGDGKPDASMADGVTDSANSLASIKAMTQYNSSTLGSISGNASSIDNNLRRMSGDLGSIESTVRTLNSTSSNQLGQIVGSLAAINSKMQTGNPSGGSNPGTGETQGTEIDYSKMPGAYLNPMFLAQSQYEAHCEHNGGENCHFFDVKGVEAEYDLRKDEIKALYDRIGQEMKEIFDYTLSGNADIPKCFELYSFNNKTYSVCPDASGYWDTLAAILLFLFYIVALMIIFRR